MKTEKYKKLIQQRILQTIDEWSKQATVEEQVIHRFFHNLKGTSGTIGLLEVEKFSEAKELLFSEKSSKAFPRDKWSEHLLPLNDLFPHLSQRLEELENEMLIADRMVDDHSIYRDRVLVIDDDVDFVTYVKEVLEKQNYPVSIALNAERGLKLFYEWKPSLILLDIVLPDKSGMYVLNQIVDKAKQEHIPIMMMSGNVSIENQIHAYRTGAMDFLAKPFDIDLLTALIDNRFAMKKDWERSIIIDELTGAYNRKHFNQMMRHHIESYKREGHIFTLVMLDLDYFKQVNDTYGHIKGDEVLQAFVATAQAAIRPQDIFCRYGGEEFALIFPSTDAVQGALLVEHLRMKFNAVKFQAGQDCFQVTFSAGVSEITSHNSHTEQLVEEADQALYNGKRGGRNQTVVYSQEMTDAKLETFLNVIIVDDDALIREIVINRFTSWKPANHAKVQAFGYADGMSFLTADWFKEGEKYIVLLDGSMPDLDGLDVLERLRNNYPEQQLLVVMLTARNNKADIVQALQIGADDYVVKPFHMQELVLRIERLSNRILS
ncbi:diguanylate cyclase [Paenibacillus sp. PL91]|uniref:GGDEF domain-containing response regulator n=1 Tax=Paenibacillus sp. PL91 TaxID=2729538 RepID=UPI00145E17CE|nr:diguanylate cyclase [Paenibacillus sp. PL91]MBC9199093.1 diguanylate cyclase [Paenibacillus sp. PL91]